MDLNPQPDPNYRKSMNTATSMRTPAGIRGADLGLVLAGALVAGALDLTFAFLFYAPSGATPVRILQFIASGVLGRGAFQMGLQSAALGAFCHFFISLCAAGVYYLASLRLPVLTRRVLLAGATFGVLVFLCMRFVIVPLSAVQSGPLKLRSVIGELCSHVFLFGIPISYAISRTARRRSR